MRLRQDEPGRISFAPIVMVWMDIPGRSDGFSVDEEALFNFIPKKGEASTGRMWTLRGVLWSLRTLNAGEAVRLQMPVAVLEKTIRALYHLSDDYVPLR